MPDLVDSDDEEDEEDDMEKALLDDSAIIGDDGELQDGEIQPGRCESSPPSAPESTCPILDVLPFVVAKIPSGTRRLRRYS